MSDAQCHRNTIVSFGIIKWSVVCLIMIVFRIKSLPEKCLTSRVCCEHDCIRFSTNKIRGSKKRDMGGHNIIPMNITFTLMRREDKKIYPIRNEDMGRQLVGDTGCHCHHSFTLAMLSGAHRRVEVLKICRECIACP